MLPLEPSEGGAAFSSVVFQINAEKGTRTFYVHGDILSQNSQPFKSIVDGNWEESVKRAINLEEWDADTVGRMIEYLYTKNYTWQKGGKFKPVTAAALGKSPSVEEDSFRAARPLTPITGFIKPESALDFPDNSWTFGCPNKEEGFGGMLLVHAKVYALAGYRAIEGLSELALDRLLRTLWVFQTTLHFPQKTGCIAELVSYVYENTYSRFGKQEQEPMRRAVTRFIALELTKLNSKGEISELMSSYGDFARDLLSDLTRRIELAEVGGGIQHKYLAGLEVSQSDINEGDILTFCQTLNTRAMLMNKRSTRGSRSHRIAYESICGEVRILTPGRELSESALGLSQNGTGPSTNIRKNG